MSMTMRNKALDTTSRMSQRLFSETVMQSFSLGRLRGTIDGFALASARRLRVVGRIGIVSEHLRDDGAPDQGPQFGLERIRFVLRVNLLTPDIKRKRLHVFCLLGRILDRLFGPFIKVVIFDAV